MRLLLINNEFPPIGGGGSTVTKYALRYLVSAGHEVTLITSAWGHLPRRETIDGATVIRVPAVRRLADYSAPWELITFGVSALTYAFWYTSRHRVDFVQAYFAVPAGWVAWVLSLCRGLPYGVYFGGSDVPNANPSRYKHLYPILTPLLRTIWRRAKFRTVCSKDLRRLASEADPASTFAMIPNGVETDRFKPIHRPPNPKVKVLFIGRLIHRKGFQRVVKALPRIKELARSPFEIEVVGTGAARGQLDELATSLGVSDLIRYVGTVPYEQLEQSYQSADVFVLMSLYEGMPAVVLEAMGCGLPVVASNVSGNNELIINNKNGFLIDGDNSEQLARRLAQLINDPELRHRLGAASRAQALDYDWHHIMRQYDTLYQEVAAGRAHQK